MNKIGLGWRVKDRITGFEGIVNHRVEYAFQGEVVGVHPIKLDKEGGIADCEMFDVTQVEVVDDKPLFKVPKEKKFKFKMGEEVRDTITGYQGKVAGMAVYINGCNRILVRPPYDKDAKDAKKKDGEFFGEGALESVAQPKKEVPKTTRGGPCDFDSSMV